MTASATNFVSKRATAFQSDTSGSIMPIFGLLFLLILGFLGGAIDYGTCYRIRDEMLIAADAATLSAVAKGSHAYETAAAMTADGDVPGGAAAVEVFFMDTLASQVGGARQPHVTAKVVKSGPNITATLDFTDVIPSHFLELFGHPLNNIGGHSQSVNSTPAYIDFYLLLDNSPSMGIAATQNDIDTLKAATGGCAFACHETDRAPGTDNYGIAHALGVKTRIDVLREATQSLMDTATATASVPNQFAMSIDTFNIITHPIAPLTHDLAQAKADAGAIDLMQVPAQGWNDDRDTNFEIAIQDVAAKVPPSDTGVDAAHTQKVVFFVTDGVADQDLATVQTIMPANNQPDNTRIIQVINPDLCKSMKLHGIKVAVIYTANNPIPGWWQQHVAPIAGEISPKLTSCASPGYFFEVAPNQGIDEAMKALFLKAVAEARITS